MYLRKNPRKNGRIHLSIVRGYRDKNGKSKAKTIQTLGYLDVLEKQYPNPIEHFQKIVDEMNLNEQDINICIKKDAIIENKTNRKNFGYVALSKVYHSLDLHKFFINKFQKTNFAQHKINNIMKLLIFARLLFPNSKKSTFDNRELFFENTNFSLDDVYRTLTYVQPFNEELQKYIYDHIKEDFGQNTDCVYYDVTNYYFEIDEPDEIRKKGVSKEHRPNPIVQMGLFMDSLGLPMSYQLFSGNTNDCLTLRPMVQTLQKNYDIGKVIVVADKGLNTGNNIAYNVATGNGYVLSQSIRGATGELKDFVLKQDGYVAKGEEFKIKSRIYPRQITITKKDGKKVTKTIDEKQVIFWSADYAKRAKAERQPAIDKAKELIGNYQKFNKNNSYGAAKYVKHLVFDKNTGEIIVAQSLLSLNEEKLKEEEQFDGYYAIVTSECEKTDEEIIDIYRGLWRIEETFKITKSELEARPVYVSREDHIQAHFLTCYIALVIARILQRKLAMKYSVSKILESIGNCNCSLIQENYYLFDYFDDILKDIGATLSIDFSKKFRTLEEIKKISSEVKK